MKKQLLFCLPILLAIASFTSDRQAPASTVMQQSAFDINDWIIDEETANRMIAYFEECKGKCRHSKKQVRNPMVKQELEKTYEIISTRTFRARYTSDDEPRYRRARGLSQNDGKGAIDGFTTVITRYEVVPKSGFVSAPPRAIYADEHTICPPPDSPPCN